VAVPKVSQTFAGLVLPENARLDLAYQATVSITIPSPFHSVPAYKVPGSLYLIPLFIGIRLQADATVSNRFVYIDNYPPDSQQFLQIIRNISSVAITANQIADVYFMRGLSAAVAGSLVTQIPLASWVLLSGASMQIAAIGASVNDIWQNFLITGLWIPTGPEYGASGSPVVLPEEIVV
jgi:hypothetical protein